MTDFTTQLAECINDSSVDISAIKQLLPNGVDNDTFDRTLVEMKKITGSLFSTDDEEDDDIENMPIEEFEKKKEAVLSAVLNMIQIKTLMALDKVRKMEEASPDGKIDLLKAQMLDETIMVVCLIEKLDRQFFFNCEELKETREFLKDIEIYPVPGPDDIISDEVKQQFEDHWNKCHADDTEEEKLYYANNGTTLDDDEDNMEDLMRSEVLDFIKVTQKIIDGDFSDDEETNIDDELSIRTFVCPENEGSISTEGAMKFTGNDDMVFSISNKTTPISTLDYDIEVNNMNIIDLSSDKLANNISGEQLVEECTNGMNQDVIVGEFKECTGSEELLARKEWNEEQLPIYKIKMLTGGDRIYTEKNDDGSSIIRRITGNDAIHARDIKEGSKIQYNPITDKIEVVDSNISEDANSCVINDVKIECTPDSKISSCVLNDTKIEYTPDDKTSCCIIENVKVDCTPDGKTSCCVIEFEQEDIDYCPGKLKKYLN